LGQNGISQNGIKKEIDKMGELFEILLELLFNRLGLFILGVAMVIGGFYGWKEFRHEARLFDDAVGVEGRTFDARIAWKNGEKSGSNNDGDPTYNYYLKLEFETDNGLQETKVYVDLDEYNSVDLNKTIQVKYHPFHPEYVVTPKMQRPSVWLATIGFGFVIILGILICLGVIISLF
jgi:hypothetical protein